MNEKNLRQNFVNTACSYSGCNEADGSHQLIIDMYNSITPLPRGYKLSYSDPWCAAFVSAMAKLCGLLDIIFAECGCGRMIDKFKAAGRWMENDGYKPQEGDIIFYDWQDSGSGDNTGEPDHVGIIVSVSGLTIKVIEGNISDKVGYRNIVVDAKYIRGYGLPDYAAKASGASTSAPATDVTETNVTNPGGECEVKLPVLRKGSAGNSVKALQLLLIGNGFSVGKAGVDGDFGTATENALMAYQAKKDLTKDGIAGPATWTALLK